MTGELLVDTALLRAAADTLDDAADAFGRTAGRRESCPLTDDSLGDSAVAREVVASASRRVEEALQAAALCATAASNTAERIRGAATSFELVEATAGLPPR